MYAYILIQQTPIIILHVRVRDMTVWQLDQSKTIRIPLSRDVEYNGEYG